LLPSGRLVLTMLGWCVIMPWVVILLLAEVMAFWLAMVLGVMVCVSPFVAIYLYLEYWPLPKEPEAPKADQPSDPKQTQL